MSPPKLTDSDKQEILRQYRETSATTANLAQKYGVSSSTISRYLKQFLTDTEYENLVQQKRLARTSKANHQLQLVIPSPDSELERKTEKPILGKTKDIVKEAQKIKGASTTANETVLESEKSPDKKAKPIILVSSQKPNLSKKEEVLEEEEDNETLDVAALGEMLGEELGDIEEDDSEEEWEDEAEEISTTSVSVADSIQVLPFSAAAFPKICYLVIDRRADLIARPLNEFAHLGNIPAEEVAQQTLPVFDNHRVARRFSNRFQRVIKVPDSNVIQKTSGYLLAKGITRILVNGKVYDLSMP